MKRVLFLLLLAAAAGGVPGFAQTQSAQTNPPGDTLKVVVEHMPEFPGGIKGLIAFLQNNLKYPKSARKAKIQGTVMVGFVVGRDGQIRDVQVLQGIGGGCDEEAARVVQIMPLWKPGLQDGEPVSVRYSIPIKFSL